MSVLQWEGSFSAEEIDIIDNECMRRAIQEADNRNFERFRVGACVINYHTKELIGYGHNEIIPELAGFYRARKKKLTKIERYAMVDLATERALKYIDHVTPCAMYVTCIPSPYCIKAMMNKEVRRLVYYDLPRETNADHPEDIKREKNKEFADMEKLVKDMLENQKGKKILEVRAFTRADEHPETTLAFEKHKPGRVM